MAVAVSLGIGGTQFLVGEISLKDMLLNTAALAFVMDLDELIHETFVPKLLQDLVSSIEELTVIRTSLFRRFSAGAVFRFVAAVTLLAAAIIFSIIPQRDVLYDAGDALCGGNRDFVHGVDEVQHAMHHDQCRCHMHGHIYADWCSLMDWNQTGAAKSTAGHESS